MFCAVLVLVSPPHCIRHVAVHELCPSMPMSRPQSVAVNPVHTSHSGLYLVLMYVAAQQRIAQALADDLSLQQSHQPQLQSQLALQWFPQGGFWKHCVLCLLAIVEDLLTRHSFRELQELLLGLHVGFVQQVFSIWRRAYFA